MDEPLSIEKQKWISTSAQPSANNQTEDFRLTNEKCSVLIFFSESVYYSFIVIIFVIVLTLITLQYEVHSSDENEFVNDDDTLYSLDDYIDFDFDKY